MIAVTVVEYDFYVQRFGTQEQLDPCWLTLRGPNNLSILVESITWVKIQIEDQLVEQVGVMVIRGPVNLAVLVVLGMDVLKYLDLPHLLAKYEHSGQQAHSRSLRAVWLRVLQTYKAQHRAIENQPGQVEVVCTPSKQKLLLAPLKKVITPCWSPPEVTGGHCCGRAPQGPLTPVEWLVDCTLFKVHWGRILVVINLGTTLILLLRYGTLADLYAVLWHPGMRPNTGHYWSNWTSP